MLYLVSSVLSNSQTQCLANTRQPQAGEIKAHKFLLNSIFSCHIISKSFYCLQVVADAQISKTLETPLWEREGEGVVEEEAIPDKQYWSLISYD